MRSRILVVVIGIFVGVVAHAQQDSQYTQYMYNTITINPAYAGSRGLLGLNGIYRSQWIGFEGAPETLAFSMNSPIGRGGLGAGLSFTSDKVGPSSENMVAADISYTIQTSDRVKLSFGIKAGFSSLDVDMDKLNPEEINDPGMQDINRTAPVIGAGAYLHTNKWYIGLSSPNFLETNHYDDVSVSSVTEKAHFYLIGGYVFDLNSSLKLKPAVLTKAVVGAPLAVDVSANLLFNDRFTLGAAYRWDAAVSGLLGFQVTDRLMLGYAYDYDTTELGNYNQGSHEIFLRFELNTIIRNTVNPRFF
ncbi:type IX secretion system membrane protein PorP/SprF [Galbibacter sp. EGI 63066]|uniref:PorP/SprF family type IX secretion system membrane protein n=1 Tax=Galbibacter sp. EGI 63066 TaxID=2993559 RepID=UPI002248B399|nr:type IX secretion system membrane protein PorP/SprF [Galbibacter sp. EGI 63066]MCX2678695.1 type IX secretion system membrane protein PorP/SprF [Galbibacter sp. EGI 63066]